MAIDFRNLINSALRDESKILRPRFYPANAAGSTGLMLEESYLRLRLARMFLKHRRELFKTKYPVVHALMSFAGLDGAVETNFVVRPDLAGDGDERQLDGVVTLDQTLLGPILYRGGDLGLVIGLYAAPADDWAQRFIDLAEGITQLTLNTTVTTVISMASTIKSSLESAMSSNGLDLKLGLDKELQENEWLAPGYLVMIAAADDSVVADGLHIVNGELFTSDGTVYADHDYIVLAIEITSQRSDWQALGYGKSWQNMLKTAAEADDVEAVKKAYTTFTSAVMASPDLSWKDRSAIVELAQKRVKAIRDARTSASFLESIKSADDLLKVEQLIEAEPVLDDSVALLSPVVALQTDWMG